MADDKFQGYYGPASPRSGGRVGRLGVGRLVQVADLEVGFEQDDACDVDGQRFVDAHVLVVALFEEAVQVPVVLELVCPKLPWRGCGCRPA